MSGYDSQVDAKFSYLDAVAEMRKRGLLEGKYEPINDEERKLVEGRP